MMSSVLAAAVPEFTAADVGTTVVVGMVIVFSVLAIIFLSLLLMERIFSAVNSKPLAFDSPFDGEVLSVTNNRLVKSGDCVVVARDADGEKSEIYSPVDGEVSVAVDAGCAVKKGQRLFSVKKGGGAR